MIADPEDPYARMARYYDAQYADLPITDLAAYSLLVARFGGPLLDAGCGTGRVALHLAAEGCEVVGVEKSQPMLLEAARKPQPAAGKIHWVEADLRRLSLEGRFGLAVFALSGFCHLLSQAQQGLVLKNIHAHLKEGGGLALDLPNPIQLVREEDAPIPLIERRFTDPASGQQITQRAQTRIDRVQQFLHVRWLYEAEGAQGVEEMPMTLRYAFPPELSLLAERAGFTRLEMYGDHDFSPYSEDAPRLFALLLR